MNYDYLFIHFNEVCKTFYRIRDDIDSIKCYSIYIGSFKLKNKQTEITVWYNYCDDVVYLEN